MFIYVIWLLSINLAKTFTWLSANLSFVLVANPNQVALLFAYSLWAILQLHAMLSLYHGPYSHCAVYQVGQVNVIKMLIKSNSQGYLYSWNKKSNVSGQKQSGWPFFWNKKVYITNDYLQIESMLWWLLYSLKFFSSRVIVLLLSGYDINVVTIDGYMLQ